MKNILATVIAAAIVATATLLFQLNERLTRVETQNTMIMSELQSLTGKTFAKNEHQSSPVRIP